MEWQQKYAYEMTDGHYFDFDYDKAEDNIEYTTMHRNSGEDVYYNLAAEATVFAQDLKEYNGTKLQFVAIMPESDLQGFVRETSVNQINRLLVGLRKAVGQNETYVFLFDAYVPRFDMQSGIRDLAADLRTLGVTNAFDPEKADFSKITDDEDFMIQNMIHKTNFDLAEEGIKAAAVTIGGMGGGGGPAPIPNSAHIVISLHKPFMYLVRDTKTGEVWFAGTVYQPRLWAEDRAEYKPWMNK